MFNEEPKPRSLGDILFVWFLALSVGGVMGFGLLNLALTMKRGEIRADAVGLRWREAFGDWKSARWEEITDYYLDSASGTKHPKVET
ncbi:hypothetical protein EON80_22275, partial [bacterium]